jgi:hypothetical protein
MKSKVSILNDKNQQLSSELSAKWSEANHVDKAVMTDNMASSTSPEFLSFDDVPEDSGGGYSISVSPPIKELPENTGQAPRRKYARGARNTVSPARSRETQGT